MGIWLKFLPSLNPALGVFCGGQLLPSVDLIYILRIGIVLSRSIFSQCYFNSYFTHRYPSFQKCYFPVLFQFTF